MLWAMGLALQGCSTKTMRNAALWYTITVPKTWKVKRGQLVSPKNEILYIQRIRDDARINGLITSTRNNIQRDMVGFTIENESRKTYKGHCAWRLIGAYRPKKNAAEMVMVRMIIDTNKPTKDCEGAYEAGQYKYILTLRTPSESYNQRKKALNKILATFSWKIPAY